jgi:hypothetical protein
MTQLRYTLVSEGSSDRVLIPILNWLLYDALDYHNSSTAVQDQWADPGIIRTCGLGDKVAMAVKLYPCELLFIHRDSDQRPRAERVSEIRAAVASLPPESRAHVAIVPVRMTEAWLLISEAAIRAAASNRNGRVSLQIPPLHSLESMPDPKQILHDLLLQASELTGRRRQAFNPHQKVHAITREIDDFSPLRQLASFQALEADLRDWVKDWLCASPTTPASP